VPDRRLPPLVVICGATATGKTELSIALASRLGGFEIVSADSRQVYRGMDIGTAKVGTAERRIVSHHGLDLVDPGEPFSASLYRRHALAALQGIAARGQRAILVGGTGLYLRAVARGLPLDGEPPDPGRRVELEADLRAHGVGSLALRLREVAPLRAAQTDLANPRRVIRALEQVAVHGDRPPPTPLGYPGPVLWIGLTARPDTHRAWIHLRAAGQFAGGLLDEAAGLRERYPSDLPALSAIGYREAIAVLDGRFDVPGAVDGTVARTRAYARRQRTWFRAEPGIAWLEAEDRPHAAACHLVERFLAGVE